MSAPATAIDPYFRQQIQVMPAPDEGCMALVGEAALRKLTKRPMLLPEQTGQDSVRKVSEQIRSHSSTPSYAKETRPDGVAMSFDKKPRTFRVRVKDALRRRIGKGNALTVTQVARAIGCSEGTIENLMGGGTSEPSSRVLRELMMFFDDSFANEVWGCDGFVIVRVCPQKAAAARRLVEAQEELRRLG